MEYKSGEKPQKGDEVLGVLMGQPARGRIVSINEKDEVLVLNRRGPAKSHILGQKVHKIKGDIEQYEVSADNFELIYRKETK